MQITPGSPLDLLHILLECLVAGTFIATAVAVPLCVIAKRLGDRRTEQGGTA